MSEQQPLSQAEARDLILSTEPDSFTNRYIMDRTPIIFDNRLEYVDWKVSLASDLGVDPLSIVVVGSSVLGFSLSPGKRFDDFTIRSDIDVAVISPNHFDEAWRWLRDLGPVEQLSEPAMRRELQRHRKSLIFDGSIATDTILHRLPFGSKWTGALARSGQARAIKGREVKVRVYRDFISLREYQARNIKNLRDELAIPMVESVVSEVPEQPQQQEADSSVQAPPAKHQIPNPSIMAGRKKR